MKPILAGDLELITDVFKIDGELNKLVKEKEEIHNEFNLLVKMNTKTQQDQSILRKSMQNLKINIKNKESEYKKLVSEKEKRKLKESNINSFIETLKKGEILFEWDDGISNFTLKKQWLIKINQ